ncbi:cystatin-like [Arapaima gigas]
MALLLMLLLSANLAMALSSLPGGPEDVNIHDKDVMEALDMAVSQYNKQDNSVFLSKVTDVIRAQKQIVAGIKYIFSVKMAYTVCRKTAVKKRCAINRNKKLAKVIFPQSVNPK